MRLQSISAVQMLSSAIAVTTCSALLAGCSLGVASSESTQSAPAQSGAPQSSALPTVDLSTPASFNPKDPGFRIFDPCSELPEDVLKSAGLGKRSEITHPPGANYRFCGFDVESGERFTNSVNLAVNLGTREKAEKIGEPVSRDTGSPIPGVYQYRTMRGEKGKCSSVAQTSGGQFDIQFSDENRKMTEQEVCARSLALLEMLYPIVEGKIRAGSIGN